MKKKFWKEIVVTILLISSIMSFSPIVHGQTLNVQQSIDAIKMEMKQAALAYVEPALKGELVPSSSLDSVLNSVKKNYQATKKIILTSNLSEKDKQAKLKELDAMFQEKIVKGLIPYIDAYNYATKYLDPLLNEIKEAEAKSDFLAVEKAYHKLSVQLKSRTSILYRFTGKAPRDLLLEKYKKPADIKRDEMIVPVTIIMKLVNAQQLFQAGKKEEAIKAIEDVPSLVTKLSNTNKFHQALIEELKRLQAIFFPTPVAPVVPTPPVTPPSTGGVEDTSEPTETFAQRALRLAKAGALKELTDYKVDVKASYSTANWDEISTLKTKWTSTINASNTTATVAQALADAKTEIDEIKTVVVEQQDLVNAEAAKIPLTFFATNPVGTVSLPTVGPDYVISVQSTTDSTKYDTDGKVQADGNSTVVYTVTHIASGKTADTGSVVVTVLIASQQSVLLNIGTSTISDKKLSINDTVEFHFSDDPVWRAAINSITYLIDSINPGQGEVVGIFQKNPGRLTWNISYYGTSGSTIVWTIKATGYPDTIVTVDVQ